MALLQQLATASEQQSLNTNPEITMQPNGVFTNIPTPTNPSIVRGEDGVYRNTPLIPNMPPPDSLLNEIYSAPYMVNELDTGTQQYLQRLQGELAARQQQEAAQAAAKAAAQAELLKHQQAMELEGLKQKGLINKEEITQGGYSQRSKMDAIAKILSSEMGNEQRVQQLMTLIGDEPQAAAQPDIATEVAKYRAIMSDDQIKAKLAEGLQRNPNGATAAAAMVSYMDANPRVANAPLATSKSTEPVYTEKSFAAKAGTQKFAAPSAPQPNSMKMFAQGSNPATDVYASALNTERMNGRKAAEQQLLYALPNMRTQDIYALATMPGWVGQFLQEYIKNPPQIGELPFGAIKLK